MRILLAEPWSTGSHQRWAEGYRSASRHDVDLVGLDGVAWRWRLRGGALPLGRLVTAGIEARGHPDLVLIDGMVDVAHLLGLTRRALAPGTPVVVYQHESQLVFPTPAGRDEKEASLRNWLSWCAADVVAFNSRYHLDAVAAALPRFLGGFPDRSHLEVLESVTSRFEVLPLGLDLGRAGSGSGRAPIEAGGEGSHSRMGDGGDPVILWPHRWEADKDPAAFLAALARAEASGVGFRLVLAGEDPEAGSTAAAAARAAVLDRFGSRVVASGPFTTDRYRQLVQRSDLVVSCARHEFFGAAVAEAVAAGCVPLLPRALAYPEVIPERWHHAVLYEPGRFGTALADALGSLGRRRAATAGLARAMDRFDWTALGRRYDDRLERLVADGTAVVRRLW
jgi:glycosyltransferase involved in cell wall biosynthesis